MSIHEGGETGEIVPGGYLGFLRFLNIFKNGRCTAKAIQTDFMGPRAKHV